MIVHAVGDALRTALQAIPLTVVRVAFVLIPLALLVWVACLPSCRSRRDGNGICAPWSLKWPAIAALGIQTLIYAVELLYG